MKEDISLAKIKLLDRIKRLGIKVNSSIIINLGDEKIEVLKVKKLKLECELDLKLLRRILIENLIGIMQKLVDMSLSKEFRIKLIWTPIHV